MTRELDGRVILSCDNCPVRMDLGPIAVVRARNRTPSGWLAVGHDRHFCPSCSSSMSLVTLMARGARQSLVA